MGHRRESVVRIIVSFTDDYIVGFERKRDAQRFLADLRDRLAKSLAFSFHDVPWASRRGPRSC